MKIAFVNLYSGRMMRGAEAFTHELAGKLGKTHDLTFFKGGSNRLPSHTFTGPLIRRFAKRAFLDAPSREVLVFTLRSLRKLLKFRPDVVVPMNGFWQLLLVRLLQPIGGYRILVTGHAGPGWDERWNLYLRPDVFVATSGPAYKWAKRTCPWTRVELIPYAIDERKFRATVPASIPLRKPLILCPAALVPYKRIDLAVRAVAGMRDASLLVLGKGPLEDDLRALGTELMGGRFLLTSVPHDSIASYYAACDVVTLPSAPQENSPMVFLESLASGKPVVVTDTPRNRWMLEGAGEYCNPQSITRYTAALKKALGKTGKKQINERILKARRKFDIRRVVKQYDRLMREPLI